MFGRKIITGILVAATLTGGVLSVAAQQDEPVLGSDRDGAISAALEAASAETGLDNAAILAQLADGVTLAAIVEGEGGDVQVVIDAAVAAMTERVNGAVGDGLLAQARADLLLTNLEAAVTEAVNGEWTPGVLQGRDGGFGGRPGRNGQGPMNGEGGMRGRFDGAVLNFLDGRSPLFGGLLDELNIDRDTLIGELQAGSTVAEAITAAGGDPQAAVAAALAQVETRLAAAVENGRLTQEQADAHQAQAELRLTEMLDNSPLENRIVLQIIPSALELAVDETGLTRADLRQQIANGATLADILAEHEVDQAAFVDTLVERAAARLNVQVVDGKLTQEQADALLGDLRATIELRLTTGATQAGDAV